VLESVRNPVPPNAIFELVVGSDMIPGGVTGMSITFEGQEEVLTVGTRDFAIVGSRGDGHQIPSNTTIILSIMGMRNRLTFGSSGAFVLKVLTAFGAVMDASTDVSAIDISAGRLEDAVLQLEEYRTFAVTKYRFMFKLGAVGLPGELSDDAFSHRHFS
jgi:hypothetical protein